MATTSPVVLTGPTGTGKTRLALEVARRIPIEVISADSRQIYRLMDIGTGKPTAKQRRQVAHHLIDILDPDQVFSAADFARQALLAIEQVRARGALPLVVGGTFLYLKALLWGLFPAPGRCKAVRARLKEQAERLGSQSLHARLSEIDPETAKSIHPNDVVRLIRALEVFECCGQTVSELKMSQASSSNLQPTTYNLQPTTGRMQYAPTTIFALTPERKTINRMIDARVDSMFESGFVQEVQQLLEAGYGPSLHSLSSLGYRQVVRFINGDITLAQAIQSTKVQTKRYAKKQLQWMKQDWGFEFLNADAFESNVARLTDALRPS